MTTLKRACCASTFGDRQQEVGLKRPKQVPVEVEFLQSLRNVDHGCEFLQVWQAEKNIFRYPNQRSTKGSIVRDVIFECFYANIFMLERKICVTFYNDWYGVTIQVSNSPAHGMLFVTAC